MARRYVPKTYNNRRFLRIIIGAIITLGLAFVISFLVLFFVFQRYVVDGVLYVPWLEGEAMPAPTLRDTPVPVPVPEETAPPVTDDDTLPGGEPDADEGDRDGDGEPDGYTIEQVQEALLEQFEVNAFGERNPQVVAIEKLPLDRDFYVLENEESETTPIDLTGSSRYMVEYRFEQSEQEYEIWVENNPDEETRQFRRDGSHTIMTGYFYFNDVNGEPKLAFIR